MDSVKVCVILCGCVDVCACAACIYVKGCSGMVVCPRNKRSTPDRLLSQSKGVRVERERERERNLSLFK